MPKLVITDEDGTREHALRSGDTVGRVTANAVQLKTAAASRKHCRFDQDGAVWFVEDLGSSNGTVVNGRRVSRFELQDGDLIQVGDVSLRFLATDVEAPEPELDWDEGEISLEEKPYLVLEGAGREGEVITIPEGRLTVGRKARHMVVLKDASVSGDHAELVREGGRVTVRDLGSSNGTLVNGRRADEIELEPGDQLRFGAVPATFGVGDPAALERTAVAAGPAAGTADMEMGAVGDSAVFEMHEPPRTKEAVWNVLALVLVLGLGTGAFFVLTRDVSAGGTGGGARSHAPENLVPAEAWSFELPDEDDELPDPAIPAPEREELAAWEVGPADGAGGAAREVDDPVRSGESALAVSRALDDGTATVAWLNRVIPVSGGDAHTLSASFFGRGAAPVLQVRWLARDPTGGRIRTLCEELVRGRPEGGAWKKLSGRVVAPGRANACRVGVGAMGLGSIVFDDVSLVSDGAAGLPEVSGFRARLGLQGTLRLSRFGRVVLDDVGVALREGERWLAQPALLLPREREDSSVIGGLGDGRGDLACSLAVVEAGLRYVLEGQGLAACGRLVFPLGTDEPDGWHVTLVDAEGGHRHAQPFEDLKATSMILAQRSRAGDDRVRVTVTGGGGDPLEGTYSLELRAGRPVVSLVLGGQERLTVALQLSFEQEEEEARGLMRSVRSLIGAGEAGAAIRKLDDILARFSFDPTLEAEARRLRTRLVDEARERLQKLTQRVDDAVFFRLKSEVDGLAKELAAARARYAGTFLDGPLTALDEKLAGARKDWRGSTDERRAARFMARARDYREGGKKDLAVVFFEYVKEHLADTDWADQAEMALQRLRRDGDGR